MLTSAFSYHWISEEIEYIFFSWRSPCHVTFYTNQVTHFIDLSRGFIKRLKICLSNGQRVQNAFFNKIRTSSSSSEKLRLLAQTADLGDCRMHAVIGFWGRILGIHFHVWATIYVKFDKRHFKSLNKRHGLLLKAILFCRSQMAL